MLVLAERRARDEPHDLGRADLHAAFGRELPDRRRTPPAGEVTSMSTRFIETVTAPAFGDGEPDRADRRQPAARLADRSRDLLRVVLGAGQVDVERDERLARPDARSRRPWPISCGPKSGSRSPRATASRRPSNSPLRTSARLARSGEVAARSYR